MNYLYLPPSTSNPPFVGKIVKWLVPSGSKIAQGDPYILIESEKVISEAICQHDGWIYYFEQSSHEQLLTDEIPIAGVSGEPLSESEVTTLHNFLNREITQKKIAPGSLFNVVQQNQNFPRDDIATKSQTTLAKLFEARQLSYEARQAVYSMVAIHIDIAPVDTAIAGYKNRDKLGISIGELVSYELSRILMDYPTLNACFVDGETYQYNQLNLGLSINIGGKGLKVVAIPRANQKDLVEISVAVKDLALCYMRDELTEENFRNITFSISDMSSLGATDMIPTLNIHQSAILGICAVNKKSNDFKLCLAFDHRVTDGTIGMTMLRKLKDRLERGQ